MRAVDDPDGVGDAAQDAQGGPSHRLFRSGDANVPEAIVRMVNDEGDPADVTRALYEAAREPLDPRVVLVGPPDRRWALPIDAILGVHSFSRAEVIEPPTTVAASLRRHVSGLVRFENGFVAMIDGERLLDALVALRHARRGPCGARLLAAARGGGSRHGRAGGRPSHGG